MGKPYAIMIKRKGTNETGITSGGRVGSGKNSEDELDLVYKGTVTTKQRDPQYLSEPTFNPAPTTDITVKNTHEIIVDNTQIPRENPGKQRAKDQRDTTTKTDAITLESSDKEFDQQLLKKFLKSAHLPLSNKPYELIKLKQALLDK